MEREEKRMEKYSEYYRYKVFGESSNTQLQLEAIGHRWKKQDYATLSDHEILIAQGRLLGAIADDVSNIYAALGIYQLFDRKTVENFELVNKLAKDYIKEIDDEVAERKRKRELKNKIK